MAYIIGRIPTTILLLNREYEHYKRYNHNARSTNNIKGDDMTKKKLQKNVHYTRAPEQKIRRMSHKMFLSNIH